MTTTSHDGIAQLIAALNSTTTSMRLAAALRAGSQPRSVYVAHLVERCGAEPDFYVRDMLTWALLQHDRSMVLDRVIAELSSSVPQARSQALHTLSKIGDQRAWPAITQDLLFDPDDEVARAAWRTAAGLVPADGAAELAEQLATQFGRGGREVLMSLSRALISLGEAATPVVTRARASTDEVIRAHATATEKLAVDPESGFDDSVEAARRARALRGAPLVGDEC